PASRIVAILIAFAVTLVTAAALATSASADAFGEIRSWGTIGTEENTVGDPASEIQFNRPTLLGVDPTDNTVYVVDLSPDRTEFRLQKFSSTGTVLASVAIPRPFDANNKRALLDGIAVDPALHRIYLLQFRADADGNRAAEQIDVFSTQETGCTPGPCTLS